MKEAMPAPLPKGEGASPLTFKGLRRHPEWAKWAGVENRMPDQFGQKPIEKEVERVVKERVIFKQ